jgi:uncharacterized membrane-anchored protein
MVATMKPRVRKLVAALWCVLALGAVNLSIAQKERLLREGQVVYLELAPVDPRSLMQGDYMALRFAAGNEAHAQLRRGEGGRERPRTADGRMVVTLDARGVGTFRRLDRGEPIAPNEVRLRYRVRNGELKLATNAFFFQEGHARYYERARFGQVRVAPDGELLLEALRDPELQPMGPSATARSR